jgi:hypothetical protein
MRHTKRLSRSPYSVTESRIVLDHKLIPRNEIRELDPEVISREFATNWQEEDLNRELLSLLAPIRVENSGRGFGSIRSECLHSMAKKF